MLPPESAGQALRAPVRRGKLWVQARWTSLFPDSAPTAYGSKITSVRDSMNPRPAAEVAFGVAGVWLMVSRIPDFGLNLALWPVGPDGVLHWVGVIHFALIVLCGVGLLRFRRALAAWLVPVPEPAVAGPVPGLQAAAFA